MMTKEKQTQSKEKERERDSTNGKESNATFQYIHCKEGKGREEQLLLITINIKHNTFK